jgi:proteasome lid subunit RPN8/RPN11
MTVEPRTRLLLPEEVAAAIRAHGAETYPHECCGALLGHDGGGRREALALWPLVNRREDSPQNRFSLTAEDVLSAERAARERTLEVIGWYHSHPDHPAQPSEYDREYAWPWYSYVIVSVVQGAANETTSWRLVDDRSAFATEELEIYARASAGGRRGEAKAWQ